MLLIINGFCPQTLTRTSSLRLRAPDPSPKNKSRDANDSDVPLNVPDSIGGDSEEKSANSPLDQGPARQSRDQDSRARDEGSSPARDEVGRYSTGNKEDALEEETGSRKVLNLSSLVKDWRIVQAFAIAKLSNKHKDTRRRREKKRARATKGARGAVSVLHSLPMHGLGPEGGARD